MSCRLYDAFIQLRNVASSSREQAGYIERLDKLSVTYGYIMHYLVSDVDDPTRSVQLSSVRQELFDINDSLRREAEILRGVTTYACTARFEAMQTDSLADIVASAVGAGSVLQLAGISGKVPVDVRKRFDDSLERLFDSVMVLFDPTDRYLDVLRDALFEADVDFTVKAQIISALLLGLMVYYDNRRFRLLISVASDADSERLKARAMTAVVFVARKYAARIATDKSICDIMATWGDSITVYRDLREVVINIIRARDTERISDKMKNEVIPGLMKLRPEIMKRFGDIQNEMTAGVFDENPEWEELLDRSGLTDKMRELTDIQMNGGDLMMVAFSGLKQFPFFNRISNWTLPFSISHSAFGEDLAYEFRRLFELLGENRSMCDSDKFSMALSVRSMPESQLNAMSMQLDAHLDQMNEIKGGNDTNIGPIGIFDSEVCGYIRDLYRFFKLYRKKDEFYDPFGKPFRLGGIPVLSDILESEEIYRIAAEFYFRRGYYAEALPMLLRLSEDESGGATELEKAGYCYQRLEDFGKALDCYLKAELLGPAGLWLLKKIAVCHKSIGHFDTAAVYYDRALECEPDSVSLIMSAAGAHLMAGDNKIALKLYYKANYLAPDKINTLRGVAWCELLCGEYDKSQGHYETIIGLPSVSAADFMNAGHLRLLRNEYSDAIDCYRRSLDLTHGDFNKFYDSLREDMGVLKSKGIDMVTLGMVVDKMRFDLETRQ